jgi:small subunit ribosomal protein S35
LDLKLTKSTETVKRKAFTRKPTLPPRTKQMALDQDWTSVWPGPRTFHPASVPLPLRQGINKLGASPGKFANAELMKIPNFLHLTPPAIKKHCEALKKFCTPWPKGLETDEDCKKHFPLEVISSDYCHSAPTIRNPLSRIVSIKVFKNEQIILLD